MLWLSCEFLKPTGALNRVAARLRQESDILATYLAVMA